MAFYTRASRIERTIEKNDVKATRSRVALTQSKMTALD